MKTLYNYTILFGLLFSGTAMAFPLEYEYKSRLRADAGVARLAHSDRSNDTEYHFPAAAEFQNGLKYTINDDTAVLFNFSVSADSASNLDNLNQGNWGEEIYAKLDSKFGEFYVGQMPNVAFELGINRPNLSTWQTTPDDIVNFINNPNWRQRHHTKFYNTLNSTLINTDGSSLKLSYISPELYNTNFAVSYIPHNNANDGLTSKFSPYYKDDAFVSAIYNHQEFEMFDLEAYISYARFENSHQEYAGGISFYRKGWTLFGSYRQTQINASDYAVASEKISYNRLAGYDGFRDAKAWNTGLGYEFFMINSTLSYFESRGDTISARSRIINWHNSIKPYKNLSFYLGTAWVDFEAKNYNIKTRKRGVAFYAGTEISF